MDQGFMKDSGIETARMQLRKAYQDYCDQTSPATRLELIEKAYKIRRRANEARLARKLLHSQMYMAILAGEDRKPAEAKIEAAINTNTERYALPGIEGAFQYWEVYSREKEWATLATMVDDLLGSSSDPQRIAFREKMQENGA